MRIFVISLVITASLLQSCFSTSTTTTTQSNQEEQVASLKEKDTFMLDSISCEIYDISKMYVRVLTSDVLDKNRIFRVVDTLAHLIPEKGIVYFNVSPIESPGAEYATYIDKSSVFFAERVVRTRDDLRAHDIEVHLDYINSVSEDNNVVYASISTIVKDFKEIDSDLSALEKSSYAKKSDFKKLKNRTAKTKRKYYPLMRKAFYANSKEVMWEADIELVMSGRSIYFYGWEYAANRNIQSSYEKIAQVMSDLRFTKVAFGTYNGGEYTYYAPYKGQDAD